MTADNVLYYGDNLDIMRRYIGDESVDLVYLDPPFNSNATYNVLFAEKSGDRAAAQIKAFGDTWHWDQGAEAACMEIVEGGGKVSEAVQALRLILGTSDMMAYLAMMAPRLVELRRVLRSTGSLYLHCDPTASHYLKLLLDAIFGPERFRSEIVWKRSSAHSDTKQGRKQHGHLHDILLFYTKGDKWTWNPVYTPYDQEYIDTFYRFTEEGTNRRYRLGDLTAAKPGGDTSYEWKGVRPYKGRFWAYSRVNMEEFDRRGRLIYTRGGMPQYKRYLDEMPGVALQDLWTDIRPISPNAAERLGYPTQKPQALLERIIKTSTDDGGVVLDPFCGCGTAVAAAQSLGRTWIGIDITHLAVNLIKTRLHDSYGELARYRVIGEPTSVDDAEDLARTDPYQFQWWALGLVGARPAEQKKGADKGIDGRIYFHDEGTGGKTKQVILSVKAGHVSVPHVRDLRGVLDREGASIGVLISMDQPTGPMRTEAASAGFYDSPGWGKKYPRLQMLTIADLLSGKDVDMPPLRLVSQTFKKAPKTASADSIQLGLVAEPGASYDLSES